MNGLVIALVATATASAVAHGPLVASLKTGGDTKVSFRITNVTRSDFEGPLHVQLRLSYLRKTGEHVPGDELWAPFDPQSGIPYEANDPPLVRLRAGETLKKDVDLDELKWSLLIQSVWPDRPLQALAGPGQYKLWLDLQSSRADQPLQLESNRVTIDLRR